MTPSKVDEAFLRDLASKSKGKYFFVKNMAQLLAAYNVIGQDIKESITETSMINVTIEQNGMGVDNVSYVPGSAYTMLNNSTSTLTQVEPYFNETDNTLGWMVNPIKLGYNWTLTYKVRADVKGFTHPVGNGSIGHFAMEGSVTQSSS